MPVPTDAICSQFQVDDKPRPDVQLMIDEERWGESGYCAHAILHNLAITRATCTPLQQQEFAEFGTMPRNFGKSPNSPEGVEIMNTTRCPMISKDAIGRRETRTNVSPRRAPKKT